MGGSVTATVNDKDGVPVTSAMFMQYIMDLANGVITQRPGANPPDDPNQLPLGINARLMREHTHLQTSWLPAQAGFALTTRTPAFSRRLLQSPLRDGNLPTNSRLRYRI